MLQLPVQAANYHQPRLGRQQSLLHPRTGAKDAKPAFRSTTSATRKETALGSISGYEISADGKKMLVSQDGNYGIIDLPKGPVTISEPLNLSGMEMQLDRSAGMEADLSTNAGGRCATSSTIPNMHGVDWKAMRNATSRCWRTSIIGPT